MKNIQRTKYIVDGYEPGAGEYLGTGGIRRIDNQTFVSQFTNPRPYQEPKPVYITKQVYVNEHYNPYNDQLKYEVIHLAIDIGRELFYRALDYIVFSENSKNVPPIKDLLMSQESKAFRAKREVTELNSVKLFEKNSNVDIPKVNCNCTTLNSKTVPLKENSNTKIIKLKRVM